MGSFLTLLLLLAVIFGVGYFVYQRFLKKQSGFTPMGMPPRQDYRYRPEEPYYNGPKYERAPYGPGHPEQYQPGYDPRYGQAPYGPGYQQQYQPGYPQRSGMNPLVAGGLGVAAGGLMGYGVGQMMAEGEQVAENVAPTDVPADFSEVGMGDGMDFGGVDEF